MRTCIFCGPTTAKLSKEHLWPDWLSEMFRQAGVPDYTASRFTSRMLSPKQWHPKAVDIRVGGVCTTCNNETLSELENECVKPALSKMAFGRATILSAFDQLALAAWITRLAMVFEFSHTDPLFFSDDERALFIDSLAPPASAWIWLFQYRTGGSRIGVGCSQNHLTGVGPHETWLVTTGVVGRLGFQFLQRRKPKGSSFDVAGDVAAIIRRWAPATLQIWPYVHDLRWPPAQYLTDQTLKAFCDRWGGVSRGPRGAF